MHAAAPPTLPRIAQLVVSVPDPWYISEFILRVWKRDYSTSICLMEKCALEFLGSQVQRSTFSTKFHPYSADNLYYRTVDYRMRINSPSQVFLQKEFRVG
jgi:hypothetical protein